MHLKGEKELQAEKLYSLLEEEYSHIFDEYALFCKNLNIKNVEEIMEENQRQVRIFKSLHLLYNMELSLEEINTLISIYDKKPLLSVLGGITIVNDEPQLVHYIKTFISIMMTMGDNKHESAM